MSPHSQQPCAIAPKELTALLQTPSPPCHSWDRATKWPLNSQARGEPRSLLQLANRSRTTKPGNEYNPWAREGRKEEDCTTESHTAGHRRRDHPTPTPQQDQAHWEVAFRDSNVKKRKA